MKNDQKHVKPNKDDTALVLSYVPLLYTTQAGRFFRSSDVMSVIADDVQRGMEVSTAKACLWVNPEHGITPVFVYDQASDIVSHLVYWSEGKPSDWFTFDIKEGNNRYVLCLHPNLKRTLQRQAAAYQTIAGSELPELGDTNVLYVPLVHFSYSPSTYDMIKHLIGKTIRFGIIDSENLDVDNPSNVSDEDITYLGPFDVRVDPEENRNALEGFLNQYE